MSLINAGVASAAVEAVAGASVAIRSGAEIDYPPFSIVGESGEAGGFSVELMRAALSAMGREVTFRTGPWAEVRDWLERGEIDALPLVGRTPEREALFDFTVPYMSLHGAIVVRGDKAGIRDFSDLSGRRVAVMKGDNAEEFLRREQRDFEIRTTPTFEVALHELAEGRHDAVVTQRLVALRLIQKTGLTDLKVIDRPIEGFRQNFCFAVHEGDRDTLALLNEGLAIVVADGTYRRLHAKWFAAMQLPTDRPIIVGGDRNFPPFEFLDESGRPAGYNVDLTRAIAREMGLNVEIRLGRWPERMEALKTGKIDVLQGMFYSTGRDVNFDFTQEHTVSHYVAVVRAGEGHAPEHVEALGVKRIVVEHGDILHDYALENGLEEQVTLVDDQETALRELAGGRHDCALVSRVAALYLIDKHGWTNLVLGKKPLLASEYCYATAKGQKALLAQFGEGLKTLENSGEYRRIYDKWLGVYQAQSTSFLTVLRYSAFVIIPLLVILLAAFVWSMSLRRQVAEKTKALQESLDRFRHVFEAANVGKSITLPNGEVNANQAFADFLGYTCDELKGKRWQELTPSGDIEANEKHIAPLLSGQKDAMRFEKRYLHKNGEHLWADVSVAMRRDTDGTPLYFMTTVVDINAHKQAEAALYKSEEFQRAMIACSPVALYTVDLDGNVLTWNSSAERIFGWCAEEIVGKPLPIVPVEKRGEFDALRSQVIKDGGFFGKELVRLRKDGTTFTVSLSVAPIRNDLGELIGILGAAEDISERKNQEKRIEWNLHRNALLSETAARLLQSDDPQTLIEDLCRRVMAFVDCQAFFNFLEDSEQGKLHLNACAGIPEQEARKIEWLEHGVAVCGCVAQSGQPMICENILNRDDPLTDLVKSYGIQAYCCHPLMIRDQLIGTLSFGRRTSPCFEQEEIDLMASVTDLVAVATSRIEMEHKLRDSESRFRSIVEKAPEPIFIQTQMRFAYLNPKALALFGANDAQELLGTPVMERFHPDFHEQVKRRIKTLNEDRRPVEDLFEQKYLRMDGSPVWVETTGQPIVYNGSNGALVFVREITARKHAEREREKLHAQLNQAQKMESVGRLAGGVAHDYNNMLSVIIGFTEIAMEKAGSDDSLQVDLKEVLNAARRSTGITRQLLAFARRQTIAPKVLELNETVEEMLKMLRRLIGEDIDLSWQPGPGRMPVFMDPSQIDQILANLCVNARDAIGGVGKITIETGRVCFDSEYCADHAGFVPGDFILLAVSDSGCGMNKDVMEKIFDPFFTTKGVGEGTGLGLSTVFGIVKQNDGFINVYSEPGKGTTFKIYLPPHEGADAGMEATEATEIPAGRGETVLVVEDETSILKLTQRMLERLNYTVLTAATPGEALTLAEKHTSEVHLLITDVVMPDMNGRDLTEKLQAHYPKLKVLFMSGYTANVIAHRGVLEAGVNFIQKPFSNRDFAMKVREALES